MGEADGEWRIAMITVIKINDEPVVRKAPAAPPRSSLTILAGTAEIRITRAACTASGKPHRGSRDGVRRVLLTTYARLVQPISERAWQNMDVWNPRVGRPT